MGTHRFLFSIRMDPAGLQIEVHDSAGGGSRYVSPSRLFANASKLKKLHIDWLKGDTDDFEWRWVRSADRGLVDECPRREVSKLMFPESSPNALDVARRLRDAGAAGDRCIVFLHVEGEADHVALLHHLPWELAEIPAPDGGPALPLVREGCELARVILRPETAKRQRAPTTDERPFFAAAVSSPLYRRTEGDLDAFHAEALAHRLRDHLPCGFLQRGAVLSRSFDASWSSFAADDALVKMFFGHGHVDGSGGNHLKFFRDQSGTWEEEDVHGAALFSGMRQSKSALLLLFACHSYRVFVDSVSGSHDGASALPPFVVATLSSVPIWDLEAILPDTLRSISVLNDAIEMMRVLRSRSRQLRSHLHDALVLFHHTSDLEQLLDAPRFPIATDLTRPHGNIRSFLGWPPVHDKDLLRHAAELGLPAPEPGETSRAWFERTGVRLRRFKPREFGHFRMSRQPITRWQIHRALGANSGFSDDEIRTQEDQTLPAIVPLAVAQEYASLVGGRLPTADEWELCAAGPRHNRVGVLRIDGWALPDLRRARGPFQTVDDAGRLDGPKRMGVVFSKSDLPMLGNAEEWATGDDTHYRMGGRYDLPLGRCLPQLRIQAREDDACAFRVVWPG